MVGTTPVVNAGLRWDTAVRVLRPAICTNEDHGAMRLTTRTKWSAESGRLLHRKESFRLAGRARPGACCRRRTHGGLQWRVRLGNVLGDDGTRAGGSAAAVRPRYARDAGAAGKSLPGSALRTSVITFIASWGRKPG